MHVPAVRKPWVLLRVEQQMLHSIHMQGDAGRARPAHAEWVALANPAEEVYSPGV